MQAGGRSTLNSQCLAEFDIFHLSTVDGAEPVTHKSSSTALNGMLPHCRVVGGPFVGVRCAHPMVRVSEPDSAWETSERKFVPSGWPS